MKDGYQLGKSAIEGDIIAMKPRSAVPEKRKRKSMDVADFEFLNEKFGRRMMLHLCYEREDEALSILNDAIDHIKRFKGEPDVDIGDVLPTEICDRLQRQGITELKDCVGQIEGNQLFNQAERRQITATCIRQKCRSNNKKTLNKRKA